MKTYLIALVSFYTLVGGLFAAPANHDPITELKDLSAEEAVFKAASRTKPVVLKSLKNGAKYFGKGTLAKISKAVDFEKQSVLLFAWKGSGQDRLPRTFPGEKKNTLFLKINGLRNLGKCSFTEILGPIL